MAATFALIFLLAAFILFVLSALNTASSRVNLTAAGLACWVLSHIVGAWK